jgi:undecaprenyl-diphosphatase
MILSVPVFSETVQVLILGVVQGLTEFLPVSSSAHLVLFQHLLGYKDPPLPLDIALHLGTLIAVFLFLKAEIGKIWEGLNPFGGAGAKSRRSSWEKIGLILIGTLPAAVVGLLFKKPIEALFSAPGFSGLMLLFTGGILLATRFLGVPRPGERISPLEALVIGLAQAIAILPGISRSGATISMALFLGVNRSQAASFSFLLSIPAILGAVVLEGREVWGMALDWGRIFLGMGMAALIGYLSLLWLARLVRKGSFYLFAPYCLLLGGMILWYIGF